MIIIDKLYLVVRVPEYTIVFKSFHWHVAVFYRDEQVGKEFAVVVAVPFELIFRHHLPP